MSLGLKNEEESKEFQNCYQSKKDKIILGEIRKSRSNQLVSILKKENVTLSEIRENLKLHKTDDRFLSKLFISALYLKINNQARANKIIKETIDIDIRFYLLNSENGLWNQKQTKDDLIFILNYIQKRLDKKAVFNLLVNYLYHNSFGEFKSQIDEKFEVTKGIIKLQKQLRSINYGIQFKYVWGSEIYEKSNNFSYRNFLDRHFELEKLKNEDLGVLLFFRNTPIKIEKFDQFVLTKFSKIFNKKDAFSRVLFLDIFDSTNLKMILRRAKKTTLLEQLTFSGKRKVYQSLIDVHKEYALIHLFALGDYPDEIMIKYIENNND